MEGCTRGGGGGGVKGQKVQVVMGDEVLELRFNKSHRASANQPAAVGRGTKKKKKKSLGLWYNPPLREVSGESRVTRPGWHMRSRFVRVCLASEHERGWGVGGRMSGNMLFLPSRRKGISYSSGHTHTPHWVHTRRCACTPPPACLQTRTSPRHQPAHLLPSPSHITSHP